MTSIEIFKTNMQKNIQASELIRHLNIRFPSWKINFDLDDRDKILKIEGVELKPDIVIELIHTNGFHCEILQ